jgi:hypothetical protein
MSDGGNQPLDIETFSIPSKINNHESSIVNQIPITTIRYSQKKATPELRQSGSGKSKKQQDMFI